MGAETIRLSLEMDEDRKKPGSGTDSEDFTSDSGAVPADSTDTDEYFVLSLRERVPFEPDLAWSGAATMDEDSHARLPDLV